MKVAEIREKIKKYKEDELRAIISEMYKAMPAKLRDSKDIDDMINDYSAYIEKIKSSNNKNQSIDIHQLKNEIETFVEYAYNNYYYAPNSVIHKKERPKWRFRVKSFIKDLQSIAVDSNEAQTATVLLQKIYKMLSYACGYYIFRTENPFRSVGIEQTHLLDLVIGRSFSQGINADNIKAAAKLVIESTPDRETLHSSLMHIFVSNLKTPDAKMTAIEQCKAIRKELDAKKTVYANKSWQLDISKYELEEQKNNLVEMVFLIYVQLCEYNEAVLYFNEKRIERDDEVKLYILLDLLRKADQIDHWLKEYEKAVKRGVKPRDNLQKEYAHIKENGIFFDRFSI